MRRRTFDLLVGAAGLLLVVVLAVAGGLLTWASVYVGDQVHTQLAAQKVSFPAANDPSIAGPEFANVRRYGGQQLTTGAQAKVYADNYIANHLIRIGGGKTYSQVSNQLMELQAIKNPTPAQTAQINTLTDTKATLFQGETLRGLLLNAYAFGKMGSIAGIAAIAAFIGAGLMLILAVLGFVHARRTAPDQELLGGSGGAESAPSGSAPPQT